MGQVGLGGGAGFIDSLAQSAAAEGFRGTRRQLHDMLQRGQAQVGGNAERPHMGAHQTGYIDQYRGCREGYGHPAAAGQPLRPAEIRRGGQYVPYDAPDVPVGDQRHQRAEGGQHPGSIDQGFAVACIPQQAFQVGRLFQNNFLLCRCSMVQGDSAPGPVAGMVRYN